MRDAEEIFISPLNQLIREQAARYGWTIVSMDRAFEYHGYSDAPQDQTFVTTFHRSMTQQKSPDGTLHPNVRGHSALASILLPYLKSACDVW